MTTDQNGRLVGWKAIAAYLGKDVRTVLRWERDRGLPIHRPPGGRGQSVYAIAGELDRWIAGGSDALPSPTIEARRTRAFSLAPLWVTAVGAIAIAAAAAAYASRPLPRLSRVDVSGAAVRAYDDTGRELWAFPLDAGVATKSVENGVGRTTYVGDLDGDGTTEALASVVMTSSSPDSARALLLCFTSSGALKWAQELNDTVRFRGREFRAPWAGNDLLVFGDRQKRIVWATHHYTWSPAVTVLLDGATGGRLASHAHDGWLMRLDVTKDARQVIAAGIAVHDEHAIAVLDAADLSQRAYFRIPRPDASVAGGETLDRQYYAIAQGETTVVRLGHSRSVIPAPETIVELSADLRSASATLSPSFRRWHERLTREGRLTHAPDACPELSVPSREVR